MASCSLPIGIPGRSCGEFQILRESVGSLLGRSAHVRSHSALIHLFHVFRLARAAWNDRFSIQETSFFFMGLLRDLHSELGACSLTNEAVETAASRSSLIMRQMEFRRVRPVVDILINHGKGSRLLPVCCRKEYGKGRKSPENLARKPLNPMKSI